MGAQLKEGLSAPQPVHWSRAQVLCIVTFVGL
jgi:hypothetical protein